jgi:apolipoprotein N-acyltransferase
MIPRLSLTRRFLYCALSAALVCLSFPSLLEKTLTPPTAFFAWFALVPLFLALRGAKPRLAAFLAFTFGFLQFGGILYWIAILPAAEPLSVLGWGVLVFYLSLYIALFGALNAWVTRRLKLSEIWVSPFLWVGLEYIRGSRPWGGFNWGEIGYSQAPYPCLLALTTFGGVYGLTFLIVWVNVLLSKGLESKDLAVNIEERKASGWPRWIYFALAFTVILLTAGWGFIKVQNTSLRKAGTVALLQPSIDQTIKWSKANETATYDKLEKLVQEAQLTHPNLIVWPETAAPDYLLLTPRLLSRVHDIVAQSQTFHLIGCLDATQGKDGEMHYFNSAAHFLPDGTSNGMYHKRHLVPFGEFVPFQKYIKFLGPVIGDLGDFDIGDSYQKFQTAAFSYSPMICYEIVFPNDAREAVLNGADALVNISNDAWFGFTASPYQHAMMAVVSAASQRKPLLRSANTGISLIADPLGRVLSSTHLYEDQVLPGDVWLASDGPTLYARWGNWIPRFCLFLSALLILCALIFKKRTPRVMENLTIIETHEPKELNHGL